MSYLKPSLATIGTVASVVLGTSTGPTDNPESTGNKGFDIAAGLDD